MTGLRIMCNLDDLKVILGADDIPRRKFLLYKTTEGFGLGMEEFRNGVWVTFDLAFRYTSQETDHILAMYNIRRCRFFSALRNVNISEKPYFIYSGIQKPT